MKTAFNIARVELQVLFYSPIAWFILIMFFLLRPGFSGLCWDTFTCIFP